MQLAQLYAFKLFLSGFLCKNAVVFCPGLVVQIDRIKIQGNVYKGFAYNFSFKNKKFSKKWLDHLHWDARFIVYSHL